MSTEIENENQNLPIASSQNNLPSFLQKRALENKQEDRKPVGTELQKYWEPARVKIVQAQSGERFTKIFTPGTVCLVPEMTKIADPKQPFWIVPVFQYTEFCVWNPYAFKGTVPVIRERTYDPDSPLARKAKYVKGKKEADYLEHYPDLPNNFKSKKEDPQYMLRYCEHINWLCALRFNVKQAEHPANRLVNTPVLFSFHHSGYFEGKQLCNLIVNRVVQSRLDQFAFQYELFSDDKTNQKGSWKGFAVNNPSYESGMSSTVDSEEDFLNYETMYKRIQAQFLAGEIYSGDYNEDADSSVVGEESAEGSGKF